MAAKEKDLTLEAFTKYLTENTLLVADTHSASRTRLVATLVQLGAKRTSIVTAGSYVEAEAETTRVKPRIVVCDYELGPRSGLDLLMDQRKVRPDSRECLFALVTGNTSQAAVARAAEEDVDTFILKPYTIDSIKKTLMQTCIAKICPSDYIKLIEAGKDHLQGGRLDEAEAQFETAMAKSPSPTLACFYLGQVEAIREAIAQASDSYQKGLTFNKIHFKCLVGLYEILMNQKRYAEAYEAVKRIAKYFPANPKRLASVLRLAISTSNFDDIESYYRLFSLLDDRSDELVNYMCSAMVVTGKHYLKQKVKSRAIEVLEKGVVTAAGRTKFIRYAIETLVEAKMVKEASGFLKRFPADTRTKEDYLTADLVVIYGEDDMGGTIKKGTALLKAGVKNITIFKTLIEASLKSGHHDWAEGFVGQAIQAWPAFQKEVDRLKKQYPPPADAHASPKAA
jgi:CheY-like chemotaxis protein